jgi:hypothetical protein
MYSFYPFDNVFRFSVDKDRIQRWILLTRQVVRFWCSWSEQGYIEYRVYLHTVR